MTQAEQDAEEVRLATETPLWWTLLLLTGGFLCAAPFVLGVGYVVAGWWGVGPLAR